MRRRFLSEFDALWFDCLNGDSRETGKLTPEGLPDPSIFSTEYNREGIRVGTAICLMVREEQRRDAPTIRFRHFWGATKRADLLESLKAQDFETEYQQAHPDEKIRFSFRPLTVAGHYLEWPTLDEIAVRSFAGIAEDRQKALITFDRSSLQERMKMYFDPETAWEDLVTLKTGLTRNVPRFDAKKARKVLLKAEKYDEKRILPFAIRPFDLQWCYYSPVRPLWREPRPALASQKWPGNKFIITRMMAERPKEQICITITPELPDYHLLRPNAVAIPILLRFTNADKGSNGFSHPTLLEELEKMEPQISANLSPAARSYLAAQGFPNPDADVEIAALIWMHALAVGYSPTYFTENADGIRQDWPRIPLPDRPTLKNSARLGREIAQLWTWKAQRRG
jgi:predicted helicase